MFHRLVLCLIGLVAAGSAVAQPLAIERAGTDEAYFTYDGEPLLSFGGLSDYLFWFADDAYDYRQWVDWAADHGMNHIRAYPPLSWKHSVNISKANGGAAGNVRLPYRVVAGSIAGGNPQFDLLQFDDAYWAEFRERLDYLEQKGIIVHLLMWNNWQLRDNGIDWAGHVFNPVNNVDGFTDHLGSSNRTDLFHSVADGRTELADAQRAFFTKLIEETHDFDNVYYDLVHELAEHQGDWGKTQVWIDSMVGAIEDEWDRLGAGRPLILGMDTGGLTSTQQNWIFGRPYFDVVIDGKKHTVANARSWRQKYDKPYIPQEIWDDNNNKYTYGSAGDRVHMRKYFWKFMMTKSQQMDFYSWLKNTSPSRFNYNPLGHNGFEDDARVLRAFWEDLEDYPNLWFVGSASIPLDTNHKYLLSSSREAIAYVSSRTGQKDVGFAAATLEITGSTLDDGNYTVDIIKPDQHSNDGLLERLTQVAVGGGAVSIDLPAFKDDLMVHVYFTGSDPDPDPDPDLDPDPDPAGAIPSVVGSKASTSSSIMIDSGVSAGDLILVSSYAAWANGATALNTPTGIGALQLVQAATLSTDDNYNVLLAVWGKIASGSEGGQTVTGGHTGSGNNDGMAHIVLRGVQPALGDAIEKSLVNAGGTPSPASAPAIGTAGTNSRVVVFAAEGENDVNWSGNWTGGNGPNYVQHAFAHAPGGQDRATWVLSAGVAAAGTAINGKIRKTSSLMPQGSVAVAIEVRPGDP